MLKIPKQLKKKKKVKKSKRKNEELFTEEELQKYKQKLEKKQAEQGESSQPKENEEWSKFKDLTTGVDSILKKTQGDLDRIKSTSFFQRAPSRVKEVDSSGKEVVKVQSEQKVQPLALPSELAEKTSREVSEDEGEKSDYAVTDDESDDDEQDDIFDTSYVEAVERGEVKLAYVPDSPDDIVDDSIFDTSYVESIIKGQETNKANKGKKTLDIGVAVEVLTGRIDNVTITTAKRKRIIPGDLLFEESESIYKESVPKVIDEPKEFSLLDEDGDLPICEPIDLSVLLHTAFIPHKKEEEKIEKNKAIPVDITDACEEDDEFSQLAAESLTHSTEPVTIKSELKPVLEDSWSVFEADNKEGVFAESVVEDELGLETYIQESDPFDTTFVDGVVPADLPSFLEDDDFDPRAGEEVVINNRRKSIVRIHLTDPSGLRESITSGELQGGNNPIEEKTKDLLSGSCSDLSQIGEAPLHPVEITEDNSDPFDTTLVEKVVVPGKTELKYLEKELIDNSVSLQRSTSDEDFNPRADEPRSIERKASRPENLFGNKTVAFAINDNTIGLSETSSNKKPVTPFYTRDISITKEDVEVEENDTVSSLLTRTQSNQDFQKSPIFQGKRRFSEFPSIQTDGNTNLDLLSNDQISISAKVLTPLPDKQKKIEDIDPFDTSFTGEIAPSKTELKLLTKEFSEDQENLNEQKAEDLLAQPDDDLFHRNALIPQPASFDDCEDFDPFDTSFAGNLQPGRTELKLLESELLN